MISKIFKKNVNIDLNNIPHHIAIVMDGNGRWAKKRFLPRLAGHRAGVEAARRIVKHCAKLGVFTLHANRANQSQI